MTMTHPVTAIGPAPLGEVTYEVHSIGVQMCSELIQSESMADVQTYCDEPVSHVIVRNYVGVPDVLGNAEGGKDEVGRYCREHATAKLAEIARA